MRKRTYIWLGIVALALAVGVVFGPAQRKDEPQPSPATATVRNESAATAVSSDEPEQRQPAANAATPVGESAPTSEPTVAQTNDKTFRVDAAGRLVLDAQTRLNM